MSTYYVDPEAPQETGYEWYTDEEEEIETFEGGKEYTCEVAIQIDPNGVLWNKYFSDDLTKVSVKGKHTNAKSIKETVK